MQSRPSGALSEVRCGARFQASAEAAEIELATDKNVCRLRMRVRGSIRRGERSTAEAMNYLRKGMVGLQPTLDIPGLTLKWNRVESDQIELMAAQPFGAMACCP